MSIKKNNSVLIVDDDPENLKVLSKIISGQGYKVRVAVNGKQAVESVAEMPPDMVLMDIQMPFMDGYEACEEIKKHKDLRDIPVIFITCMNESFNKVKAFECGGVDYITKPFQFDEVKARVKTHMSLGRALKKLEEQNKNLDAIVARKTQKLQKALAERDLLIKEIYHRVNNNFQIFLSLLNIQKVLYANKSTDELLEEFTGHVMVIAGIHQELYQSSDFRNVNIPKFIDFLKKVLLLQNVQSDIEFIVNTSSFYIDINHAIPLGHILFELLSKCLKYNKPMAQQRQISINLQYRDDAGYEINISDNSTGIEGYVDFAAKDTPELIILGIFLNQLNATFDSSCNLTTEFSVKFKKTSIRSYTDIKSLMTSD